MSPWSPPDAAVSSQPGSLSPARCQSCDAEVYVLTHLALLSTIALADTTILLSSHTFSADSGSRWVLDTGTETPGGPALRTCSWRFRNGSA